MKTVITLVAMIITATSAFADRNATNYHKTSYYNAPSESGIGGVGQKSVNTVGEQVYNHNWTTALNFSVDILEANYREGVRDGEAGASKEDKVDRRFNVDFLYQYQTAMQIEDTTNKWDLPKGYNPRTAITQKANEKDRGFVGHVQFNAEVAYHIGFVRGYEETWKEYKAQNKQIKFIANQIDLMNRFGSYSKFKMSLQGM